MELGDWSTDSGRTFFIAEVGVNHNGDPEVARCLVDAAADAGADAVKFQTYTTSSLVSDTATTAEYQREATGGELQRDLLRDLELGHDDQIALKDYCDDIGIRFLSTPFGKESASFLDDLGVQAFKIGSGDLTNVPLLRHVAGFDKPMIVSTGMSTLPEVRSAYLAIREANSSLPFAFLHCVSVYPTEIGDVNLGAIQTLGDAFSVPVGYSDHTTSVEIPAFSVVAGACIVEKHLTLDRSMDGPDHSASLEPRDLKRAVSLVREATTALGDGIKRPVPSEEELRYVSRKGLFARRDLAEGETFTADDVAIMRPAEGLSPTGYDRVIGRSVRKSLQAGEPITESHVGAS